MQPTLWIVGTSVSIEDGGYATRLGARAQDAGWTLRNLSVGDQTSLMGWMRVCAHADAIRPGDVLVWEYSLLDALLTPDHAAPEDVRAARRLAWNWITRRGVRLLALFTPPLRDWAARTGVEHDSAADAAVLGVPVVDLRALAARLGVDDPAPHYRDDRHPATGSPLVQATADALWTLARQTAPRRWWSRPPRLRGLPDWRWHGAAALAAGSGVALQHVANSLLAVDAASLQIDQALALPPHRRVVAVGVLSRHGSGAVWCGHPGCPPMSTRLPDSLPYRFLLRGTGLPCLRHRIDRLVAAPDWCYHVGEVRGYGQAPSQPGPIEVFGALLEGPN